MQNTTFDHLNDVLTSKSVDKDEIIFKEGDSGGDGFILSLGGIVLLKNKEGGKLIEKHKINPMQVFGVWNSICGSEIRLFTAKALEKSSLLIIPRRTLDKKLKALDPFLRFCFRQILESLLV